MVWMNSSIYILLFFKFFCFKCRGLLDFRGVMGVLASHSGSDVFLRAVREPRG